MPPWKSHKDISIWRKNNLGCRDRYFIGKNTTSSESNHFCKRNESLCFRLLTVHVQGRGPYGPPLNENRLLQENGCS